MLRRILVLFGLLLATLSWLAPARAVDDQNCEDFNSQAAAQQHLRNDPSDPDRLDPDNDGVACSVTAYADSSRDVVAVSQAAKATTTTGAAATTSTTVTVLPTTVAQTGAFSLPLFGAGALLVGIGMSFRGKRADGVHYVE